MSRIRSLSFPRFSSSKQSHDSSISAMLSPAQSSTSSHSRDSSSASTTSSPLTSATSARGHSRWPGSSSSSLVAAPDSPVTTAPASKTTLHDLAEEPAERDDFSFDQSRSSNEPLCICDTPFCEHGQHISETKSPLASPAEWLPGDDYFSDGQLYGEPFSKRRRSGQAPADGLTSRLSRRFPSFSKRFSAHRSSPSVSSFRLRSAPHSRSTSLRLPKARSVTAPVSQEELNSIITPPFSPATTEVSEHSVSPSRARASSRATSRPVDIEIPTPQDDSIDREELASTPLLPPMMATYFNKSTDEIRSPLQSPTIATPSAAASALNTPITTPVMHSFPTPPLSAKPSKSSLHNMRFSQSHAPSEIPPLAIAEESDPWAVKLGHANFHIVPEPYFPNLCDAQSCKQLADDWESARVSYMRQAARINEHYGVTSQTYKLTQEKWAEIDAQWRMYHEQANTVAQASGESPFFQPLAETQTIAKMPSLNDPQQPSKFPEVEENDIVGPMVRYAKLQHEQRRSSRKPAFLKIFTDPASLLAGNRSK